MAPILPRRVPRLATLAVGAVVAVAAVSAALWVHARHAGPEWPAIDPNPVHRVVVTAIRLPDVVQEAPVTHRVEITASRLQAAEPVHRVVVTAPRLPVPQTLADGALEPAHRPL